MPDITAAPIPSLGHVRVDLTWPGATCALVERVIDATGARAPLRPYVWPCPELGEYQHLSAGEATFWDTEAPLDEAFHYEARVAIPDPPVTMWDDYNRTVANSWGTAGSGQSYTITLGPAAQHSVATGLGLHTINAADQSLGDAITALSATDVTLFAARMGPATQPVGATPDMSIRLRSSSEGFFDAAILFAPAGNADLRLRSVGSVTKSTSVAIPGAASGVQFSLRFEVIGLTVRARAWPVGTPEPTTWLATLSLATSDPMAPGSVEFVTYGPPGMTTPLAFQWDNWSLTVLDPVVTFATITSESYTLDSLDGGWLRDPLRPCSDLRLVTCWPEGSDPVCVPGSGIFFANMDSERYQSSGEALLPSGARRPVPIVRQRRDRDSTLTVVSRTFDDRDDLIELTRPGSPIQFVFPAEFGVPDTYMDAHDVTINRGTPDHRYEPRLHQIPFSAVDRPVGPTQGVCGERFMDFCSDSWGTLTAAGTTYDALLGAGVDPGWETYADVAATYATYALAAVGNTYQDLFEGT